MKNKIITALAPILFGICSFLSPKDVNAQESKEKDKVKIEQIISENSSLADYTTLISSESKFSGIKVSVLNRTGYDKIEAGAQRKFDFDFAKGFGELLLQSDSDKNYGAGLNFRINIPCLDNLTIGTALERKVTLGDAANLESICLNKSFDKLNLNIGAFNVDKTGFNGRISYTIDNLTFSLGVTSDIEGKGYATLAGGKASIKGSWFDRLGLRAFAQVDNEGNYVINFLGAENSNISQHSINAMTNLDNGVHDKKLLNNLFDIAPALKDYVNKGLLVNATYLSKIKSGNIDILYQFSDIHGIAPKFGISYKNTDGKIQSVTVNVGAKYNYKNLECYFDFYCTAGDNQKPFGKIEWGLIYKI